MKETELLPPVPPNAAAAAGRHSRYKVGFNLTAETKRANAKTVKRLWMEKGCQRQIEGVGCWLGGKGTGLRKWHSAFEKALDWYSPLFAVKFDSHIRENEMQENHQRHKSFFECPRAAISRFRSYISSSLSVPAFLPFVCVKNCPVFTTIAFSGRRPRNLSCLCLFGIIPRPGILRARSTTNILFVYFPK